MNIISKSLDEIKYRIPGEILRVVFQERNNNWRNVAPVSIDHEIYNKIIKPRVIVDSNIIGGQTIIVSLEGLPIKYTDTYTIVYEIPADRLMNRSIMSVLSVSYMPFASGYSAMGYGTGVVAPNSINNVMSAGQRVGDSHSNIPPISNATAELVGFNTVLIRDMLRVTNIYQLRCVVAHEENLNDINPRSYLHFAKACELAVKSYIYNKMIIAMDSAYLSGGQELGAFKTYIEGLADSEQMYQEYLRDVWMATSFMNSGEQHARFIRMQINPAI